jgi:quercetin dioxygenase-like cupin family protein
MKCLRIFASADGESHLAEIEIPQSSSQVFPNEPPLRVSRRHTATAVQFVTVPPIVEKVGWHNTPDRMLGIVLSGTMEFETSDGSIRQVSAGGVVLAEDTIGKGHISRHPGGATLAFVLITDDA